ncbi:MAG: hypothetical protein H7274_24665, partial [Rhodoferax sp.]|nr:hypothetical protein [Rhodoferax sp.]
TLILKRDHDVLLADLKAAQDRSLRHVQSTIDREIHRAKKLADKEFDVLSEGWTLLVKAFDAAETTATEWVKQLHKYTQAELDRTFEQAEMKHWEIDELMALHGDDRTEYFRRYEGYKRLNSYLEQRRALAGYLRINGIFMPDGMKERFEALDRMIATCFYEFQGRLDSRGPVPVEYDQFAGVKALHKLGVQLRDELEALIRIRLWSAAAKGERSELG